VVDISTPALLYRLRQSGAWLTMLVGQVLAEAAPKPAKGRLIRIVDGTTVCKPGPAARTSNQLWRVHAAFDLPFERFGSFELTDQHGGEQLDRCPVIPGEIRIADRVYMQPARIAEVVEKGADIVLRAGWRSARWLDASGQRLDLLKTLQAAGERIDRPIGIACKGHKALSLRLVAVRKVGDCAEASRKQAREQGRKGGYTPSDQTMDAADWLILVTSLPQETYSADDVVALYRLRWRIELAFKRLKSLIGLRPPPGTDERSAKPWLLAHLLIILLLEPHVDALEDSPPEAQAA